MLSRAMTRRILTGLSDRGNDGLGRELQPGGEVDSRLVSENLARRGDVGPGVTDVSGPRRLEAFVDRLAEEEADRLGNVVHARGRACGDVEDPSARPGRLGCANRRVHGVRDVREVTGLLAVSVDRDRLALIDRGDEERNDRGVLRVRALARAEDVEVAKHDRL